ncbi:MAG: 30S ribosomal protein S17 [Candidatus Anoxychlamydiales bacterium]|nr:30S ribosomal protein S17 [Candidatus Anoxychlamydiales bacterium]
MKPRKKVLEGIVMSDKMDKTLVVKVVRKTQHPKYKKLVEKWKKYYAHDAENRAKEGNKVKIIQSRPLSKLKKWKLLEVL